MSRSLRAAATFGAAVLVAGGAGFAGAAASQASAATTQLTGDVLPNLATYTDLGAAPTSRHVQIDITIARPNPAGEQALYQQLYTPGSPQYHHFLTPAEFDAQFGVAQATLDSVQSFATSQGLTVTSVPASHDLVVLDGTIAQVQRTFGISIHNYRSGTKTFFANTTGPTVPSGLSINGVVGLNNLLGSHLYHNGPDNPVPTTATHGVKPAQDTCQAGTCVGLTTPQDLWAIYDQPGGATADPNGNKRVDFGQGQQMAIFGEGQSDPVITNLRTFERLHKLPYIPVQVKHTDGKKVAYTDNAGEVEWDLDTQSSTGMAPDVSKVQLYFGHDLSDQSVLNVFNAWADDPTGPLQANASYGECEENTVGNAVGTTPAAFSAGQMYTLASEAALIKANMEGRTLFSSAGDTGSSCPTVPAATLNGVTNSVVPIVNYPASSPHAVDVGGTVLYGTDTNPTTRQLEYTWTYSGGGTSFVFAKPGYQNGIANIAGVCTLNPDGTTPPPGEPCRGAPDVAAQSGDVASNGYGIVASGETNYPGGGTSLSSPLWMGMWTRIQATAPAAADGTYPGLGFANETLYRQFKSTNGTRDFFDIGGGPQSPPAGNGFFISTPGWDYTSGMGAPDVSNLATDINGTLKPTHPILPKKPATTGSSTRTDPCTPLFTDPSGDDSYALGSNTGGNPQLDILSGNIALSSDQTTLRTFLTVKNLSMSSAQAAPGAPSGAANEYYMLWSYGGTTYFANAEVDTTAGTVTYADGTVSGNQYSTVNSGDTGHLTLGPNGVVEVDVPLAHVGNPPLTATLTGPGGQTKVLVGSSSTGGSLQAADSGGPQYDDVVSDSCATLAG